MTPSRRRVPIVPTNICVYLSLLLLCGCSGVNKQELARAKGVALGAFGFVSVASQLAEPEDPDSLDACTNCNGTGKIGDGRIVKTCPICNGTGKSTTVESAGQSNQQTASPKNPGGQDHEVAPRSITVYSRPGCQACSDWLTDQAPKWRAQGFEVLEDSRQENSPALCFLIQEGSRRLRVTTGNPWEIYTIWRNTRD